MRHGILLFALLMSLAVLMVHCAKDVAAPDDDVECTEKFKSHKIKHRRNHKNAKEEESKKKLFCKTHAFIREHNKQQKHYTVDHNEFSDMTDEERNQHLGYDPKSDPLIQSPGNFPAQNPSTERIILPYLDYRGDPCLGPIKNQYKCGSCWAFSAIGTLEFNNCKRKGYLEILSEQHLLDCDPFDNACTSGTYGSAWNFLRGYGGANVDTIYGNYTAARGACAYRYGNNVGVSYIGSLPARNSIAMQEALYSYGPLSVSMAVIPSFQHYTTGVYNDPACDYAPMNHALVLVGYGTVPGGLPYWILRNSWGTNWGYAGYGYIQRGVNKCGIENNPGYVVAA